MARVKTADPIYRGIICHDILEIVDILSKFSHGENTAFIDDWIMKATLYLESHPLETFSDFGTEGKGRFFETILALQQLPGNAYALRINSSDFKEERFAAAIGKHRCLVTSEVVLTLDPEDDIENILRILGQYFNYRRVINLYTTLRSVIADEPWGNVELCMEQPEKTHRRWFFPRSRKELQPPSIRVRFIPKYPIWEDELKSVVRNHLQRLSKKFD